jgi:hypothetical protein
MLSAYALPFKVNIGKHISTIRSKLCERTLWWDPQYPIMGFQDWVVIDKLYRNQVWIHCWKFLWNNPGKNSDRSFVLALSFKYGGRTALCDLSCVFRRILHPDLARDEQVHKQCDNSGGLIRADLDAALSHNCILWPVGVPENWSLEFDSNCSKELVEGAYDWQQYAQMSK